MILLKIQSVSLVQVHLCPPRHLHPLQVDLLRHLVSLAIYYGDLAGPSPSPSPSHQPKSEDLRSNFESQQHRDATNRIRPPREGSISLKLHITPNISTCFIPILSSPRRGLWPASGSPPTWSANSPKRTACKPVSTTASRCSWTRTRRQWLCDSVDNCSWESFGSTEGRRAIYWMIATKLCSRSRW